MNTLKASELRIGNYIRNGVDKFDPEEQEWDWGKVLSIGQEEVEFEQIYCECMESFEWFFKDNYSGIPVTKEWLLKFGFHTIVGNNYSLGVVRVWIDASGVYFFFQESVRIEIHYIHQLQNLYFALLGQELTIKEDE